MNRKVRRVDNAPHARTVVFHFTIEEISGFLAKLLYAVAYVPPEARFRVRGGFSVALPWRWRARRARPTMVTTGPSGIGAGRYGKDQIVMQSPARHHNYTTPRLQMASAGL